MNNERPETILFYNSQQMRDFLDYSAHRGVVGSLYRLVEFRHAETFYDFLLLFRITDDAPVILDPDRYTAIMF